jgi:hypothetical protein
MWSSVDEICVDVAHFLYEGICGRDRIVLSNSSVAEALHAAIVKIRRIGGIAQSQVLGGVPDVITVCEELLPVPFLLLSSRVMVLLGRSCRHVVQIGSSLSSTSVRPGSVSPVRIYATEFRKIVGPPSLGLWRGSGSGCEGVDGFEHRRHQPIGPRLNPIKPRSA